MNTVWNLENIYRGFDDPAFIRDRQQLEERVQEFAAFTGTLSDAGDIRKGVSLQEEISVLAEKLATYTNLRQAANTKDPESASQMGKILDIYSGLAAPQAAFETWASGLPELMDMVERDPDLRDYRFLFANMKENSRHLLPGLGEEIMAKMAISGSGAWSDLHGYVTSTVPVSYRDQTINLSAVRNLAYDPDPQVRKDAYAAELACYEQIQAPVAFALNSIKLETLTDCRLRGYTSPLARTLKQSHMSEKTLHAMFSAIEKYLPKFRQYLKAKAKALGHSAGLPWYDLFAPMGSSSAKITVEEARDYLLRVFSGFDAELADMIREAFENEWIDFYPRDGKSGGAFCAGIQSMGESRILANFDGAFTDIITLGHELGHAFHNLCIMGHRPLNKDYSMPVAETASTFNECVINNAAIARAETREEKLALLESQLQDATQIICDIYSRFRFEAMVFENREQAFLDADTLCGLMTKAQEESYGDGLDPAFRHPYMWICKSHYYGPTFYNFPYAFGGLFARGLYAQYRQEGASFVPKYKKLLYTTPIATAEEAARTAGIDLTDIRFWRSALAGIGEQIDQFCQLVQEV